MPWLEMRKLLRTISPEIAQLAQRGDAFAKSVIRRYYYAFEHPTDTKANLELRIAIEDYMSRDLRVLERVDLGSKYGHLLDEKTGGTKIFVPNVEIVRKH